MLCINCVVDSFELNVGCRTLGTGADLNVHHCDWYHIILGRYFNITYTYMYYKDYHRLYLSSIFITH